MTYVGRAVRSVKNITTSYELAKMLGIDMKTASGVVINADTALRISAVFACVRIVAEDIGKLSYPVYRQIANDGREQARGSPFWSIVHDRWSGGPNSFGLTSQQGREYVTACALLRGNGFAFKNKVGGQVYELLPIPPSRIHMEPLPDGEVIYKVQMNDGTVKDYMRDSIFHLAGPMIDSWYSGASIVKLGAQGFGAAAAAEEYAARFYGNGSTPRGILTTENKMDATAAKRMKSEWEEMQGGLANVHRTAVFEQGLKFQNIGMNPEDTQLLDTRKFGVTDIARWFRIPAHKVNDLERSTYSNIEQQAIEYVTDTLMAWGVRWDSAINQQIIVTNQVYAELNFNSLLRGDIASRFAAYQSAILTGWMTRQEPRRLENMNPIDGLDEPLVPTNEQTVAALAAGLTAAGGGAKQQ